jgi:hypothetical protein
MCRTVLQLRVVAVVVGEGGRGRPCPSMTRTIATTGRPISTEQTDEFFEKIIFFFFNMPWLLEDQMKRFARLLFAILLERAVARNY